MKQHYQEYINQLTEVKGKCAEITLDMQGKFPELVRVRGYYVCPLVGERPHWWLKDGQEVVDPTAAQFSGFGQYQEWDETQQEPTGMCPNCGGHSYDGATCCSSNCHTEYLAYVMSF